MRKLTHNLKIKAKKRMKNCGFTMVELIVVVAILGVLAAILIPTLLGITIRATVGFCEYHGIGTEKADRLLSDNGGRKPQELYAYGGRLSRSIYYFRC